MTELRTRQPDLSTPRLRLRPLRRADAALIALHASDFKVARMTTSIPHPYPPGAAEAYVAGCRAADAPETVWALDAGEEDENGLIGVIGLKVKGDGVAEIGYWIAPAFWNAGYAGEAVDAVRAEAYRSGHTVLTAQVFQDNLASVRVLTRAGFVFEGAGEAFSAARRAMVPTFRYRLDL